MATDDQAVVAIDPGPVTVVETARPNLQQIKMIFGLTAALSLGIGLVFWSLKPEYSPVFNSLTDRDALQVAEVLRAENVPFKIENKTGLILVPNEQLSEVRMKLTAAGVPYGSASGFETLQQEQSLGTSRFMETARYQHVLETELSRTITAMRNIESARVHLALPKQSVFVRKQSKPTASVMVKLFPGRILEDAQVTSIVHMVASSVPYMQAGNVTVVDQWGRMLSASSSDKDMAANRAHLDYIRNMESNYVQRIEALLTPIVGYGRVKAEVNADIDFTSNESFQESYAPDANKVRSEQVQESENVGNAAAIGIPGALTNQPPAGGAVDENGVALAGGNPPTSTNRNSTRNFELDKTITRSKRGQGIVRRLTVAVVLDDKLNVNTSVNPETGEETVSTSKAPYTEAELLRFTELVKSTIGFREDRGDIVEVINSSFQAPDAPEPLPEVPVWEQPWVWTAAKQLLTGFAVLFVVFGIVRPAVRSMLPASGTNSREDAVAEGEGDKKEGIEGQITEENAEEADEDQDVLTLSNQSMQGMLPAPPQVYGDILNMARVMATDDPKRVAKVIKDWVAEDG